MIDLMEADNAFSSFLSFTYLLANPQLHVPVSNLIEYSAICILWFAGDWSPPAHFFLAYLFHLPSLSFSNSLVSSVVLEVLQYHKMAEHWTFYQNIYFPVAIHILYLGQMGFLGVAILFSVSVCVCVFILDLFIYFFKFFLKISHFLLLWWPRNILHNLHG